MVRPTGQQRISGSSRPRVVYSFWEAIGQPLECSPVRGSRSMLWESEPFRTCWLHQSLGFHVKWAMGRLLPGQSCNVTEGLCSGPMAGADSVRCPHTHRANWVDSGKGRKSRVLLQHPSSALCREGLIIIMADSQERCFKEF